MPPRLSERNETALERCDRHLSDDLPMVVLEDLDHFALLVVRHRLLRFEPPPR